MLIDLAITLAAVVALMGLCWRYSLSIRDVSFIDAIWAYGMVYAVAIAAILNGGPSGKAGWMLVALVALWGLRLGTHLITRWRRLGRDPRYEKILGHAMEKQGMSFAKAAWWRAFGMQGPLLWGVCLPAQAGILADDGSTLPWWGLAGAAAALIGIAFETIGDAQLEAFRADPANKGQVMDKGLWRYTRHPNYFGDFLAWWGIFTVGIAAGAPWWTVVGPLFLSFTLTRWSGAPMLEHSLKKHRPGYDDYIRRTSGFFPLPPKRG
jgi:steroid 5-alpha reductase family enzyme